ncbi:FecR family protein [Olivibacter sp. CPCC 100613]|uniref:FecR family protein n=1 Tax=Olivibacter sp. CPCC 100613 TaxID=3079931 RepID=UPI002FF47311
MQQYKHYRTIDFLSDDHFADWVRNPKPDNSLYWQEIFTLYPMLKPFADEARQILLHMRVKSIDAVTYDLQETILDKAFETEKAATKPKMFALKSYSKWIIAALILLVSGFMLWEKLVPRSAKLEVVMVKEGGAKQIKNSADMALMVQLPDQSTVILQPKSFLTYQSDSFLLKREVYLAGEAFFDVSKNEQIPFIVNTDQLCTTVLGTSFFIQAKPSIINHQVLVTSGSVRVKEKRHVSQMAPEGLLLKAGEETQLQNNRSLKVVPSSQALHIKEDLGKAFDFQNMPMDKVAETIQNHYGVQVQIENPVLAKRTITAFLGSISLQEKLNLIAKAMEAKYQLEDGIVVFTLN